MCQFSGCQQSICYFCPNLIKIKVIQTVCWVTKSHSWTTSLSLSHCFMKCAQLSRERSNNGEFSGRLNRLSIDGSQSRAIWRKQTAQKRTCLTLYFPDVLHSDTVYWGYYSRWYGPWTKATARVPKSSNLKLTTPSFSPQRERIREKFVAALKEEFAGKGLRFTKGERVESWNPIH